MGQLGAQAAEDERTASRSSAGGSVPATRLASPMKSATNRLAGSRYSSPGVPCWAITAWSMTMIASDTASASSWSWVTYTARQAELLLQLADLLAHPPQLGVQVRERLVEQQHLGLQHQRARDRDPLLLPARQLAGQAVVEAGEAEQGEPLARGGHALARGLRHPQSVADVLQHGHVRKQGVGLEHHAHVASVAGEAGDVVAADEDLPAGRHLEAGDHSQRRRLSAAGWPEQRHQRARLDGEGDVADGHDRP